MINADALLSDLNPPQREAVQTLSGPLLILAGAGSGKTRVVTRRIAYLVANGVRPWEILAITFTNKAAAEMRKRVEDLVKAKGVWLSTFHSFCARLLRREAPALGLAPDYSIYDEDDAEKVLKQVVQELHLEDPRYKPGAMRALISRLKARGEGPGDVEAVNYHTRLVQQIYQGYQSALRRNQGLDFDDLLLLAVQLLKEHEDVRERYRARFRYLLVDEYQDTNTCQYQLIKLLGLGHRNVCATGDPDQSIYAWRGADVRNILSYEKDFPDAKVVRLEQNYRSTQRILAVAAAVIRHNQERKEKGLWTANPEGHKVSLNLAEDGEAEAYQVVADIKRLVDAGRDYSDLAVFYRTNAQSQPFEHALVEAGIPYQLVGGTPFYERREVKDALAYLRLIVNPADDVAFRRVINVPKRGLGNVAVDQIAAEAARRGCPLLAVLGDRAWIEKELKPKPREELRRFKALMDGWQARPQSPVGDLVVRVLRESGLEKMLEQDAEEDRLQNLEQLANAAAVYDEEHPAGPQAPLGPPPEPGAYDGLEDALAQQASLAGFLENAALVQPTDALEENIPRVTLMTLHMAKGLEFPVVFLAGLEDGLLPLIRRGREDEDSREDAGEKERRAVEEERRLFYVGVTRARELLFLLHVRSRLRYGQYEDMRPSRFIDEIPESLLERQGGQASRFGFEPDFGGGAKRRHGGRDFEQLGRELDAFQEEGLRRDSAPKQRAGAKPAFLHAFADRLGDDLSSQLNEGGLEVGDRVLHEKFGEGVVESFSGSGLSAKARVHFRKAGPKLLLLSMAKLKKL